MRDHGLAKYIFAITPATLSTDEDDNWEGTITTLKKTIAISTMQIKQQMQKRMTGISSDVTGATDRIVHLDEKVNELQAS